MRVFGQRQVLACQYGLIQPARPLHDVFDHGCAAEAAGDAGVHVMYVFGNGGGDVGAGAVVQYAQSVAAGVVQGG